MKGNAKFEHRGNIVMFGKSKKAFLMLTIIVLMSSLIAACTKSDSNNKPTTSATPNPTTTETETEPVRGEPIVIKFGTHWQQGDDPNWTDPVTGESGMAPDQLAARKAGEEAVLEQLNVKVEWVQYPEDVRESLLKSVLANDPIVDIALLWGGSQGTLLGQNIFQQLDEYADIFADPDDAWMFGNQMFGGVYFLNYELNFVSQWPLVYNIDYLDQVDALKENGQTVYPHDLWKRGEWTWSKFEDYLTKVNEYYANKMSPVRTDVPIKAFQTDYRQTSYQAIHSNGGAVYGADGLTADSVEAKEAIEYIDRLMSKNLMMSARYGDDSPTPGWTWNGSDFGNGETVFTNMVPWLAGGAGQSLAERGESMGVVPFPRADKLAVDDPKYQMVVAPGNQMAVLKGIDKERTKLALEAYKIYWSTVYKTLGNSDNALDYLASQAKAAALNFGLDVTNETYGETVMEAFMALSKDPVPNEFATILSWAPIWEEQIMGSSIYGLNGSPKYASAIDANKNRIIDAMSATESALKASAPVDNMPPSFSETDAPRAVAAGTDPATVDWNQFVTAKDGVDGDIPFDKVEVDVSAIDFNTVGKYDGGLVLKVKDNAGNEASNKYSVYVYDGNNTTAPTITAKAEYRAIKVDEDASAINWKDDFIDSAVDKDGLDVKKNVTADVSELDVTTPGEYDVAITVTDYVGNTASLTLKVKVE